MIVNSKKKLIISETFLNELLTKHNEMGNESSFSKVYLGDKWVKKISRDNSGKYPRAELLQYETMQEYPQIFPATKIKYLNSGIVILQQKMNVKKAQLIWDEIDQIVESYDDGSFWLRLLVQKMAKRPNDPDVKNTNEKILEYFQTQNVTNETLNRFKEYLNLSLELYNIRESNPELKNYSVDLHRNNYGVDDNNNLKIIDFIV